MVARDDDGARAGLGALFDEEDGVEALARVRGAELLREVVVADAAGVHDRLGREDVLRAGSRSGGRARRRRCAGRTAAPRAAFCDAPPAT